MDKPLDLPPLHGTVRINGRIILVALHDLLDFSRTGMHEDEIRPLELQMTQHLCPGIPLRLDGQAQTGGVAALAPRPGQ